MDKSLGILQERAIMVEDGRLVSVEVPIKPKKKKKKKSASEKSDSNKNKADTSNDSSITFIDLKTKDSSQSSTKEKKDKSNKLAKSTGDKTNTILLPVVTINDNRLTSSTIAVTESQKIRKDECKIVKKDIPINKVMVEDENKAESQNKTKHESKIGKSSNRLARSRSKSPGQSNWRTHPIPGGQKPNDMLQILYKLWPMDKTRSYRPDAVPPKRQRSAKQNLALLRKWGRSKKKTKVAGITVEASVLLSKRAFNIGMVQPSLGY